jgi:hypothetical protein
VTFPPAFKAVENVSEVENNILTFQLAGSMLESRLPLQLTSKPARKSGFSCRDNLLLENCPLCHDDLPIRILHVLSDHALGVEIGAIEGNR